MRWIFLLLGLLSVKSDSDAKKTLNPGLSRFISDTKAELAQSFFGSRVAKKEVAKVNVTEERDAEIKFAGAGNLAALFRRSKQNYVVNGSQILKLRKSLVQSESSQKYFLDSLQEFSIEEGAVLFEQTEWKNIFFLAVCYRRNYCRALMSHPTRSITFQQRLTVQATPTDLQFFVDDEALFLIVAGDPCKIYRWTGTYFDEQEELDTSGATAVATFRHADATVIVVTQNLQMREVYSKVFVRKNRKTELIQMLQTKEASDVLPYSLTSGNETLHFIFVLSIREEGAVFWWNGREFSLWKKVQDVIGPGRIYFHKFLSHGFFFFARENKLNIYHPTELTFDLIQAIEFDRHILDVDLREEVDGPPMLLLLKNSNSDSESRGTLTISLLSVDVKYVPLADNQIAIDPVLKCLLELKNLLQHREAKLNESMLLSNEIAKKSKIMEVKMLTVPKVELKSFKINELKVNPSGEKLEATPTEIKEKLEKLKEESDVLLAKLESTLKKVRYRFHGDIIVGRMKASNIYVKKFNDRAFDLNNIISVRKNQTLSGAIHVKTLSADSLTLPSISGVYAKDLLLRKKPLQAITGEHTVRSVKARNVIFGKLGKLNGTLFSGARGFDGRQHKSIPERSTFARMGFAKLEVDYINNEPAEQWLSKVLPTTQDFGPNEEALNFTDLQVTELVVSNINGLRWQDYLMASKRSGRKENRSSKEKLQRVQHLRAKKINGVEAASFLTKDTPQKIDSAIAVTSVTCYGVKANLFVGGPELPGLRTSAKQESVANQTSLAVSEIVFEKSVDIFGRSIDFDKLNRTYWMKSRPQEIDASLTFASQVTIKDLETLRINDKAVWSFAAAGKAPVEGRIIFEDVVVVGNVTVSHDTHRNVNLKKLYNSAAKTEGENHVKGRKVFLGRVSAESVSLRSVNGHPLGYHLPTATGILRVKQAEVVGNVSVKEGVRLNYLNGHDFNRVMVKHVRLDESDVLRKGNYSSLFVKKMNVENINGIPCVNRFRSYKKRERLRLVIGGDLEVAQLQVSTLNNITLDGYFDKVVFRNGTALSVRGKKSFRKVVTVRGNLDGALNGYNLAELKENALSKSKPQDVTGKLVVDVLNVNNTESQVVDGVASDNLLFQDSSGAQTIRSDVVFGDVAIAGAVRSNVFMDGCDLSRMTNLKVDEIRKLGKLDVMGNLTWNRERGERGGISYLYENAVRKNYEQIVGGSVTFRGATAFEKLTTKKNINDLDLEFIVKDAVYGSVPVQEIFQDVTFRGKVTANNILIENNIIVDNINGVDILDFGQKLIRNNADIEIRGNKTFLSGFTTHRLTSETLNGAKTEPIIICDGGETNGSITFTATTFRSVKTLKHFNVLHVNNVNLSTLLAERLSKKTSGKVRANLRVKGSVSIKGDAGIGRINDINIKDTIPMSGEVPPTSIKGILHFNNTLSATEKVEVSRLNYRNVTEIKERMLLNQRDSVIKGNMIFKGDAEFQGNVDAMHGVNGCKVETFKSMEARINMEYPERTYAAKIRTEIDKIANNSKFLVKPIIFIDLHARAAVHLPIVKAQKIKATYHGDNVKLDVYGVDDERCRSPNCYCITQKTLIMSSPIREAFAAENVFPVNYKYFDEYLNVEVTVTSSGSSYHSSCEHAAEANSEYATLSWSRKENRGKEREMNEERRGNSTKFMGHLSDVKFFRMTDSVFVIMAFHVPSAETKMNGLNIVVHEFDGGLETMKKVQEIEMSGVETVELFWTPKGMVLVAGNGYDSEMTTESVDSAIYRFSESDNQFRLLRSVKTHGILHIATVTQDRDSFIFLVQKQSWPLLILKYNREYDNYYFSQKLDSGHSKLKSNFLSAAAFTTSRSGYEGDVFVGIVHSDGSFRLFKYKHIEGFVEEWRQEQSNVEMLMPFRMDSRQYLLAVSSGNHSVTYELAEEG